MGKYKVLRKLLWSQVNNLILENYEKRFNLTTLLCEINFNFKSTALKRAESKQSNEINWEKYPPQLLLEMMRVLKGLVIK